jgi:hypothetical protein
VHHHPPPLQLIAGAALMTNNRWRHHLLVRHGLTHPTHRLSRPRKPSIDESMIGSVNQVQGDIMVMLG